MHTPQADHSGDTPERVEARAKAIRDLLERVKSDPSVSPEALSVFQRAVIEETDPCTAAMGARGIGLLLGPDAGRDAQRTLLRREQPEVVGHALLEIESRELIPEVLEALEHPRDFWVKRAAIRVLGRLRDPRAFPVLVGCLEKPELTLYAVEALGDLGDLRAIAYLEPLASDETPLAQLDERGATLTQADIVGMAIRRVRYLNPGIPLETTPSIAVRPSTASVIPSRPTAEFAARPPPLPPTTTVRKEKRWPVFLPLALACAEVPWAIAIMLYLLGHPGPADRIATVSRTHFFDVLASIPALAGLITGLGLLLRARLKRRASYVWVIVGSLMCLPGLYLFGSEFLRNR